MKNRNRPQSLPGHNHNESLTSLPGVSAARDDKVEEPAPISPKTASRILAILAEENNASH